LCDVVLSSSHKFIITAADQEPREASRDAAQGPLWQALRARPNRVFCVGRAPRGTPHRRCAAPCVRFAPSLGESAGPNGNKKLRWATIVDFVLLRSPRGTLCATNASPPVVLRNENATQMHVGKSGSTKTPAGLKPAHVLSLGHASAPSACIVLIGVNLRFAFLLPEQVRNQ